MTTHEIQAIKDFVEASIAEALDNAQGSDEGLLTSIRKREAETILDNIAIN